eukprot:TRINITY_DN2773_c2_g1_i1.p1 TRINITY_DN2773_c2_g1~~TRINITY_DN2773_c2_g1_i1.p1  ORF type:complete len:324 (+),score=75.86 TRINITY_DN2773_c2_g1_i1:173-1144(+)
MPQNHVEATFLATAASWKALLVTCTINGATFAVSDTLAQLMERHWAKQSNRRLRLAALDGKRADGSDCSVAIAEWRAKLGQGKDVDVSPSKSREDPSYPSNPDVDFSRLSEAELSELDDIVGHLVSDPREKSHNKPGINSNEFREFSCVRCIRFGMVGGVWGGVTTFFRFSIIAMIFPGFSFAVAVGKTCVNQFLFSPVLHGGVLLLNEWGKTGSFWKGWDKLCTALLEVQLVTWGTKVPLNFICFSFMPSVPLQALFMRTYDIFFYVYISMVADREDRPEIEDDGQDELADSVPPGWEEEEVRASDVPVGKDRGCCADCCVM